MATHIAATAFEPKTYCGRSTFTESMVDWVTKARAKANWHLGYTYCKRCKRKAG